MRVGRTDERASGENARSIFPITRVQIADGEIGAWCQGQGGSHGRSATSISHVGHTGSLCRTEERAYVTQGGDGAHTQDRMVVMFVGSVARNMRRFPIHVPSPNPGSGTPLPSSTCPLRSPSFERTLLGSRDIDSWSRGWPDNICSHMDSVECVDAYSFSSPSFGSNHFSTPSPAPITLPVT